MFNTPFTNAKWMINLTIYTRAFSIENYIALYDNISVTVK